MARKTYSHTLDPIVMQDIDLLAEEKYKSERGTSMYVNELLTEHTEKHRKQIDKLRISWLKKSKCKK